MAVPRPPGPMDRLRRQAPRTGPSVPNMGGINAVPLPPQRTNLARPPMPADSGRPGPVPGAGGARPTYPLPPTANVSSATGRPTFAPAGPVTPQQPPPTNLPMGTAPVEAGVEGEQPVEVAAPGAAPEVAPEEQVSGAPQLGVGEQAQPSQQPAQPLQPQPLGPPQVPGVDKGYQVSGQLDYVPETYELDGLQSGQAVSTPEGDVYRDRTTGKLKMRLNQQGKAAYQQARTEKLKRYGNYPGMEDPAAPPPPVNPRGPDFNPFAAGDGWID